MFNIRSVPIVTSLFIIRQRNQFSILFAYTQIIVNRELSRL